MPNASPPRGFGFTPLGRISIPQIEKFIEQAMDARRGTERVLRFLSGHVRGSYDQSLPAVRDADIVITHPIAFGAILAIEKLRRPWISSVLAPISYLSAHDPPLPARDAWILKARFFGPGAMRAIWNLGEWATRGWIPEVFAIRKELGLPAEAIRFLPTRRNFRSRSFPNGLRIGRPIGRRRPSLPASRSTTATKPHHRNSSSSSQPARRQSSLRSARQRCAPPAISFTRASRRRSGSDCVRC